MRKDRKGNNETHHIKDEDDEHIKKDEEFDESEKLDKRQTIIREKVINQLISRIDKDSIAFGIKEKGCIVGKSIVIEIIGISCWNQLTLAEKDILAKQVDKLRVENRIMFTVR